MVKLAQTKEVLATCLKLSDSCLFCKRTGLSGFQIQDMLMLAQNLDTVIT